MKKDIPLIMERIVYTYIVILFVIFIMKLIGLDCFGISMSNPFIMALDKVLSIKIIYEIICFCFIMLYQHIMTSIVLKEKTYKLTLISSPITFLIEGYIMKLIPNNGFTIIFETLYLFTLSFLYNVISKGHNRVFKRTLIVCALNMVFQFISFSVRYKYSVDYIMSPTVNIILNLDYTLLMLLMYKIYFKKGDVKLCQILEVEVGSFLQKLTSLKRQSKKLLTNYLNNNKKEKFEFSLYFILFLLWNIFTVIIVLFIAQLNHTFIECIFIITSFWLNKTIFGKAFHLKNALHCFILSNLSYYCLDRITIPLSISIFIPIMLGIGLSYITSKLINKTTKPLYKGMNEEELKQILDKITNNQLDYKICKLYYVDRFSELKVAMLTNYSIDNIKKRKKAINDKLKELII